MPGEWAVNADRRDKRSRALRHLLRNQADYTWDRLRRSPEPVRTFPLITGVTAAEALGNIGRALASFRVRPVPEDAAETSPGAVVTTRYMEPDMLRMSRGANLFDADDFRAVLDNATVHLSPPDRIVEFTADDAPWLLPGTDPE